MDPKERFQLNIKRVGRCWVWQGGQMFWDGRRAVVPARFSFRSWRKSPGKKPVRRTCKTANCVCPSHLALGLPSGEGHGRSTLSDADVKKIRRLYKWWGHRGGVTQKKLAAQFRTSVSNIHKIIHRQTRK